MSYELIQSTDDGFIHTVRDMEGNFIAAMEDRGYKLIGVNTNPVQRAELQGQPKFKGLCGPMWGGVSESGLPVIRYECPVTYRVLSQ